MEDQNEILLKLYQEEWIQCRHHQDLRSKMTGVIFVITAGLTAIASIDKILNEHDLFLSLLLISIGLFAPLFTMKQHERFRFHLERSRQYRNKIDDNLIELNLKELRKKANSETKKAHPFLYTKRLKYFWAIICSIPFFIGLIMLFLIIL